MDFFNKKKIKQLENEIKKLNDTLECVQLDRNDLQKDNERLRTFIEESNIKNNLYQQFSEENNRLIDWIEKILDASNIYRLKEGDRYQPFTIPMYKEEVKRYDDSNLFEPLTEKLIIPELHIIRKRFGGK
jgi:hypothetical protein